MILPTVKDINKAKAQERKIEIDNGVALASQIDSLRATFAQERVAHENWKKSSIEALNQEIQGLQDGIDAKKREITQLDEQRRKLIEPLDLEWMKINAVKEILSREKEELVFKEENLQINVESLEQEELVVADTLKRAKQNEEKTQQNLRESEKLRQTAQKESQDTKVYRQGQEDYYQARNKDLEETIKTYEVALKTIEIREQTVKDKELELLEREILLKDRQAMFERNKLR